MRVILIDAAGDIFNPSFEGSPEEIVAATPEGGSSNLFVPPEPEHVEEPPIPGRMLRIAVYNTKGFPINVLQIDESMAVSWIRRLSPGMQAVTLTDTPYAEVEMAGDLPPFGELNLAPEVISGDPE